MLNESWAREFSEILLTLDKRQDLRDAILAIMERSEMPGKVLEGGNRLETFKGILSALVQGKFSLNEALNLCDSHLGRVGSPYGHDNRVFSRGWAERLVRVQLSRFYNQAVLELFKSKGIVECFVPHSSTEDSDSKCSLFLAGQVHNVDLMLDALVVAYNDGVWSDQRKVPDHPNCTHVISPVPTA